MPGLALLETPEGWLLGVEAALTLVLGAPVVSATERWLHWHRDTLKARRAGGWCATPALLLTGGVAAGLGRGGAAARARRAGGAAGRGALPGGR